MFKSTRQIEEEIHDRLASTGSMVAKGLWITLWYIMMFDSDRCGYVRQQGKPVTVGQMAVQLMESLHATKRALRRLRSAGLIQRRRSGYFAPLAVRILKKGVRGPWTSGQSRLDRRVETERRYSRNRRLSIQGSLAPEVWSGLQGYFCGLCAYCHRPTVNPQIEHMQPVSRDGANSIENIVPACGTCNSRKGNLTVLEFVTGFVLTETGVRS